MTAAEIRDTVARVPEKATISFLALGRDIQVLAEWNEGTQPMCRVIVTLPRVLSAGGPCK